MLGFLRASVLGEVSDELAMVQLQGLGMGAQQAAGQRCVRSSKVDGGWTTGRNKTHSRS